MKLESARRLAKLKAMGHRPYVVTREKQTADAWVFSLGDPDGRSVTANLPMIVIDKEGNRAREVYLPSPEGFAIIKDEAPIPSA